MYRRITSAVPKVYEKSRTATSLLARRFATSSGTCTYRKQKELKTEMEENIKGAKALYYIK